MPTWRYDPQGHQTLWTDPNSWLEQLAPSDPRIIRGNPVAGDVVMLTGPGGPILNSTVSNVTIVFDDFTPNPSLTLANGTLDATAVLQSSRMLNGSGSGSVQSTGTDLFAGTWNIGAAGVISSTTCLVIPTNGIHATLTDTGIINDTNARFAVSMNNGSFINDNVINVTYVDTQTVFSEQAFDTTNDVFSNNGRIIVNGGTASVDTLTSANSGGPIDGIGQFSLTNASMLAHAIGAGQTITFNDAHSLLTLAPTDFVSTTLPVTPFSAQIQGFRPGDTIDLGTVVTTVDPSTPGIVRLFKGITLVGSVDLTPFGSFDTYVVRTPSGSASSLLGMAPAACFAAGTRITTEDGSCPVEGLTVGRRVLTTAGALRPVRWIGQRHMNFGAGPPPVRIYAGAFGPGLPARDLILFPEHALFLDGVLVPAGLLLGAPRIAAEHVTSIHYFHVELDAHDVLFAEGLPCESWLDTGSRSLFANAPVDHRSPAVSVGPMRPCAPFMCSGPILEAIRARLIDSVSDLRRVA